LKFTIPIWLLIVIIFLTSVSTLLIQKPFIKKSPTVINQILPPNEYNYECNDLIHQQRMKMGKYTNPLYLLI